jgi:hypothetical protein
VGVNPKYLLLLLLFCFSQVDQGLNLQVPLPGGRKLGFNGGLFNRMVASATHFMQVRLG